jgi:glycosyltransferase involved in cell wall biosynthesis
VHAPEVSVCVPLMDAPLALDPCVQSVLAQSFKDFELLIVLDEDNAKAGFIKEIGDLDSRIRTVIAAPMKTRVAALNACIAQARGEYIKFLLPTDVLKPNCLEKFLHAFKVNRSLSLASCAFEQAAPEGTASGVWRNQYPSEIISGRVLAKDHAISVSDFVGSISATFFRRDYGMSGIDERFFNLGELDFWLRLAAQGDYLFISQPLCKVTWPQDHERAYFNKLTMLAYHDYILLADNFLPFMIAEQVNREAFIDLNRTTLESAFRDTFNYQDLSLLGSRGIAEMLVRCQSDDSERTFTLECYIRLCYELLVRFSDLRPNLIDCRAQLAKVETELAVLQATVPTQSVTHVPVSQTPVSK